MKKVELPSPIKAETQAAANSAQTLVYNKFINESNTEDVNAMKNIFTDEIEELSMDFLFILNLIF